MSRNTAPLFRPRGGTFTSLPARRFSSPFVALFGISLLGGWIASCKDDADAKPCVPGDTQLCAGPGRCQGVQACLADGISFGECDCSGPLRQPSTDVDVGATVPVVGRRCQADADCGEGLECFTADSNDLFGGGPAGGYCSLRCMGDANCTAIDQQSSCVGFADTTSVCLRTCRSQDPTSLGENKCLTRSDLVCKSEVVLGQADFTGSRQVGWCFPQCGSDEDCPGRRCDLARGLCVNNVAAGLGIGERCTDRAQCAGQLCVAFAEGEQACSAPCVLGQPVGCGYGPSTPQREVGCLGPQVSGFLASEGVGDTGFCAELCDVDTDCLQNAERGWVCIESDGARERFGRAGVCGPPAPPDAGAGDAGDGGTVQDASVADGG